MPDKNAPPVPAPALVDSTGAELPSSLAPPSPLTPALSTGPDATAREFAHAPELAPTPVLASDPVPNSGGHPAVLKARAARARANEAQSARDVEEAKKLPGIPPAGVSSSGGEGGAPAAPRNVGPIVFNPPGPPLEFAESSNVKSVQLDPMSGVAAVVFANGATAKFGGFTQATVDAWRGAASAGKWFHANVKNNSKTPLLESVKK